MEVVDPTMEKQNNGNVEAENVRIKQGERAGTVGVGVNLVLGTVKLTTGLVVNSLAVVADGVNNLSDSFSSLVTLFSFRWAGKPADREHPFGHGRVEYIAALTLSFLVMAVGLQFVKSSVARILHPVPLKFTPWAILLMFLSVFTKLLLGLFYKRVASKIRSGTLQAAAIDSFSDMAITSCVALSLVVPRFTTFPADGIIGMVVALFILYSSFRMIRATLTPLLGTSPDPDLAKDIRRTILEHEPIQGVHDLIVHTYGPEKHFASAHAEVPAGLSTTELHEVIDHVERELEETLRVSVVIHMDPVNPDSEELRVVREEVDRILEHHPSVLSMHDLRIVGQGDQKKLLFDIVLSCSCSLNRAAQEKLTQDIDKELKRTHPFYTTHITVDREMA